MSVGHQPDEAYFDRMAAHARTHWWYEGRRRLVAGLLGGRLVPGARVLDVGCGTGDNLAMLAEVAGGPVVGVELSAHAVARAPLGPTGTRVAVARAEELPLAPASVDLACAMDVVEHLDDDVAALEEVRRVLRPAGLLLVTVPAYQWLWSAHDDRAAHRRRYVRPEVEAVVRRAGFDVERSSYFNSFLVPPAVLLRRTPLRRLAGEHDEEVGESSAAVGRVMGGLSSAERWRLARGRLPFGLSIFVLARRAR
ncbi:MAG: class I SAM-dependent methyltransferase [Acidimicrobiia bacterium]